MVGKAQSREYSQAEYFRNAAQEIAIIPSRQPQTWPSGHGNLQSSDNHHDQHDDYNEHHRNDTPDVEYVRGG